MALAGVGATAGVRSGRTEMISAGASPAGTVVAAEAGREGWTTTGMAEATVLEVAGVSELLLV